MYVSFLYLIWYNLIQTDPTIIFVYTNSLVFICVNQFPCSNKIEDMQTNNET